MPHMTPKHGDGVFGLSAPPQCQMCDRTQGVGPLHISDVHPEVIATIRCNGAVAQDA